MSLSFPIFITSRAEAALVNALAKCDVDEPVIALVRYRSAGGPESKWGIGIYDRRSLTADACVFSIGKFEFVLDATVQNQLTNSTIDLVDGRFHFFSETGQPFVPD